MKVKTECNFGFSTRNLDKKTRKVLETNGIYYVSYHADYIVDVAEEEIIKECPLGYKPSGYAYANRLYDIGEREKLKVTPIISNNTYIIEDGYASNIPYMKQSFNSVDEFIKYMKSDECKREVGDIE